jgi:hypothetical protein
MAAPRYRKISAIDNRVTFVTCRARAAVTRSNPEGSYHGTASISQQRSASALENQQRLAAPARQRDTQLVSATIARDRRAA